VVNKNKKIWATFNQGVITAQKCQVNRPVQFNNYVLMSYSAQACEATVKCISKTLQKRGRKALKGVD